MAKHVSALVTLRPATAEDIPVFFAQQADPIAHQMVAFGSQDRNDERAFREKWIRNLSDLSSDTRAILFEGDIAGHVVSFVKEGKRHVGYLLGREFWGKGIATGALTLLIEDIPIRPLHASTAIDNLGSMRVLEKCGFTRLGTGKAFASSRGTEIDEVFWILE